MCDQLGVLQQLLQGRVGVVARHQCFSLVQRAVDHHHPARCGRQQGGQRAGCRTPRAHEQYIAASQADASIGLDVVDQAQAVGVVGMHAVGVKPQGVGGLRQLSPGALLRMRRRLAGLQLEGHGDVATACAIAHQVRQCGVKTVQWRQQAFVPQRVPGQLGKTGVDLR